MSTELVAIERIIIGKGEKGAEQVRKDLARYLRQFLDTASIESMSLSAMVIKLDGKTVLDIHDKTGGKGLDGLDTSWQHTSETEEAVSGILRDVDVEAFLSYGMIHYFSHSIFYGSAFWSDVLQDCGAESVRYQGLEYYDVDSHVSMLTFDGKTLCDSPDYVSEEAVKDIPFWFCYTFEMELEAGETFTVQQVDKMLAAVQSVRNVFGREEGDVADVDEDCLSICTSVTLKPNQIQDFTAFLKTMLDIAEESGGSLSYTAEFVPIQIDTFAAMILDMDNDGIVPRFFKF